MGILMMEIDGRRMRWQERSDHNMGGLISEYPEFEEEGNEIGSHSIDHQRLGNLSDNEMKHQIIESKKIYLEIKQLM